jgi:hypothetical protein
VGGGGGGRGRGRWKRLHAPGRGHGHLHSPSSQTVLHTYVGERGCTRLVQNTRQSPNWKQAREHPATAAMANARTRTATVRTTTSFSHAHKGPYNHSTIKARRHVHEHRLQESTPPGRSKSPRELTARRTTCGRTHTGSRAGGHHSPCPHSTPGTFLTQQGVQVAIPRAARNACHGRTWTQSSSPGLSTRGPSAAHSPWTSLPPQTAQSAPSAKRIRTTRTAISLAVRHGSDGKGGGGVSTTVACTGAACTALGRAGAHNENGLQLPALPWACCAPQRARKPGVRTARHKRHEQRWGRACCHPPKSRCTPPRRTGKRPCGVPSQIERQ